MPNQAMQQTVGADRASWIVAPAAPPLLSLLLVAIGAQGRSAGVRGMVLPVILLVASIANSRLQSTVARRNAARVIQACEAYRAAHGRYPEQLADLVPSFIAAVPRAKYFLDDNGFRYTPHRTRATLSWACRPPFGREVYGFAEARWAFVD